MSAVFPVQGSLEGSQQKSEGVWHAAWRRFKADRVGFVSMLIVAAFMLLIVLSGLALVAGYGNVVSITTTVESGFGSFHMTRGGFLLNNQLTDFSAAPIDSSGALIANRVAANKRPRSSMAPTLMFRTNVDGTCGEFRMATGSPGGATIIQYVIKTIVGLVDWGLDAQQTTSMVAFGAANTVNTNVGGEHPNVDITNSGNNDALITGLRGLGHTVNMAAQSSGICTIVRRSNPQGHYHLEGGADPRREGIVLGDLYRSD